MGPTWFDVEFQVIDVPASYNLLLGRPWIHAAGAVASTLHQAIKFEWNHQEVIIHGDGSNPIYSRQAIPMIGGRRKIGGETYHHIERVNAIDKDKWWDNKIESILNWSRYEPGKGLGKNLQGITKPIKLKKHGTTFGLGYEYTWEEFNHWSPPWRGPYHPLEHPIPQLEQVVQPADPLYGSEEDEALAAIKNMFLEDDMDCCVIFEEGVEEGPSIQAMNQGEHLANWSIRTTSARRASGITITYLDDEPTTVTCNETVRQRDIDSEEDEIPEEVVGEVKNFENRPKSKLDETEVINLGNAENVKETRISVHLSPSEKEEYTEFLKEYEDIFAWSYDDMNGLSTSIVAHKLPTDPACLPVKQKLRKFKPDMSLKIKKEVTKQVKARVLRVVEYPTWLANVVPVPKKDGKVRVYIDYRDLNRASPKDDFPLPNIHILIDNCAKHEIQSFIDCFARYHQIWMDEEDAEKTAFITPWGMMDPLKYIFQKPMPTGKLAKWHILLSEFDIVYVTQKAVKGQALADNLAENPHPDTNFIDPIQVKIHDQPAYCAHVEEEADGKPWFHDIRKYLTT
ncbi:uncharacterized protein [Nicotiana sylvestris]|uniref:uncharacterized protein n=1 Tax=Nicotiana sylvestris TaxID=4096 RepID=UPI00388CDE8E